MKRFFGLLLVCAASFTFVGCDDGSEAESENQVAPDAATQQQMNAYGAAQGEKAAESAAAGAAAGGN
jgi:hypothetical protein